VYPGSGEADRDAAGDTSASTRARRRRKRRLTEALAYCELIRDTIERIQHGFDSIFIIAQLAHLFRAPPSM
jgi:hypothetical protein